MRLCLWPHVRSRPTAVCMPHDEYGACRNNFAKQRNLRQTTVTVDTPQRVPHLSCRGVIVAVSCWLGCRGGIRAASRWNRSHRRRLRRRSCRAACRLRLAAALGALRRGVARVMLVGCLQEGRRGGSHPAARGRACVGAWACYGALAAWRHRKAGWAHAYAYLWRARQQLQPVAQALFCADLAHELLLAGG
jgi:hypothetical protein